MCFRPGSKERIVVLGSGWAGYALAKTISPSQASRILISPRSHFVFTPLIASTAVGTLEFRAAVEPCRKLGLTEFHQAWASNIDFANKTITIEANQRDGITARSGKDLLKGLEFQVPYDKLVVAVGCYSQTFGVEGVKEHACFLRDATDARTVRLKVLQKFEQAALPNASDAERKRLLHFAVVGGGPTGIEFAAELHDLVHEDLAKLYPELMPHVAITIYDIAPKVLPMFDRNLAAYATNIFKRAVFRSKQSITSKASVATTTSSSCASRKSPRRSQRVSWSGAQVLCRIPSWDAWSAMKSRAWARLQRTAKQAVSL